MRSQLKVFILALLLAMVSFAAPAAAQLATFTYNTLTAGPIRFNLGNGVSGTITFTGAVGSGLYNPTTVGAVQTSTFVVVAPGAIGRLTFDVPITKLYLQTGTGVAGARTDKYVVNRTNTSQTTTVNTASAAIQNRNFTPATPIVGVNFSSTSANPFRFGIRTTTTAQVAPLGPVGATLLGNLAALGALVFYRRRRTAPGALTALRTAEGNG